MNKFSLLVFFPLGCTAFSFFDVLLDLLKNLAISSKGKCHIFFFLSDLKSVNKKLASFA